MAIALPAEVSTFFAITNGNHAGKLDQCFAEAGVVRDERHTYEGLANISRWLTEAQQKYNYSAEPVAATDEYPVVRVRAKVSGTFPGSPIELEHVFELSNGRILRLEIRS